MSDQPDQEEARQVSDDDWHSRPLMRRQKPASKEPNVPVKSAEELAAEQREIQTVLQASQQAGVDPSVLTEHLGKVAERLAKAESEDTDSSE